MVTIGVNFKLEKKTEPIKNYLKAINKKKI